jgi:hypothetical protein
MSVQPSLPGQGGLAGENDHEEGFLFSLTGLALFVACALGGLLLAYGVAAPTGATGAAALARRGLGVAVQTGSPPPAVRLLITAPTRGQDPFGGEPFL